MGRRDEGRGYEVVVISCRTENVMSHYRCRETVPEYLLTGLGSFKDALMAVDIHEISCASSRTSTTENMEVESVNRVFFIAV